MLASQRTKMSVVKLPDSRLALRLFGFLFVELVRTASSFLSLRFISFILHSMCSANLIVVAARCFPLAGSADRDPSARPIPRASRRSSGSANQSRSLLLRAVESRACVCPRRPEVSSSFQQFSHLTQVLN